MGSDLSNEGLERNDEVVVKVQNEHQHSGDRNSSGTSSTGENDSQNSKSDPSLNESGYDSGSSDDEEKENEDSRDDDSSGDRNTREVHSSDQDLTTSIPNLNQNQIQEIYAKDLMPKNPEKFLIKNEISQMLNLLDREKVKKIVWYALRTQKVEDINENRVDFKNLCSGICLLL